MESGHDNNLAAQLNELEEDLYAQVSKIQKKLQKKMKKELKKGFSKEKIGKAFNKARQNYQDDIS